ncbi:hypothetical protein [Streptomyces sp. NPDC047079]
MNYYFDGDMAKCIREVLDPYAAEVMKRGKTPSRQVRHVKPL